MNKDGERYPSAVEEQQMAVDSLRAQAALDANNPTCLAPDDSLATPVQSPALIKLDEELAVATWGITRLLAKSTNWDDLLDRAEALSAIMHGYEERRNALMIFAPQTPT